MKTPIDRRTFLGTTAAAASIVLAQAAIPSASAQTPSAGTAKKPPYEIKPLPFDPKTIPGLSAGKKTAPPKGGAAK